LSGDLMVMEQIEGSLKTRLGTGPTTEWAGHFIVPPEKKEKLQDGHRYRLVLIDGRSGTISVRMSVPDSSDRPVANFHGKGAFRR
jgi:hypothetical protein